MPSKREQYHRMYNFAGDFIYTNMKRTSKTYNVCNEMANDLIADSIKINTLVFIALDLACIGPLYKIFVQNEKELILPVILPFIDPDTEHGFYVNFVCQLVTCLIGMYMWLLL